MELQLKFDEKAFLEEGKLTIHFREVLEESRCPIGTVCVWEGFAKILLSISQEGKEAVEVTLSTSDKLSMSQEAVAFEYLIKLDRLLPFPTEAVTQPNAKDYVATLTATKMSLVPS